MRRLTPFILSCVVIVAIVTKGSVCSAAAQAIPVQPSVHTAEVYGTITTDLRIQGVVPPSSALHPAPVRR